MTERLLFGVDVGTTSTKAVVYTEAGRAVASARTPMPWAATATGAQVAPARLLGSVLDCLARAAAGAPDGAIAGVGITSMGETGVLLDRTGTPLGPLIAWHDTRDDAELADLRARIDPVRFARTTGLPLRHQWSLTKHRWLRTHHRDTTAAVRRLNIAEWVVRALGGDEGCELSLASRTGWLRLHTRDWWEESLDWAGASASLMPDLVEAGTALGAVTAHAAPPRLAGAVLTVAGHDHQAAAIGAGALGEDDELDSCGTAEALLRSVAPALDPVTVGLLADGGITVGWHAVAGRWCLLGGTTGGLTLQRVLAALDAVAPSGPGSAAADGNGVAELDRLAAAVAPSAERVQVGADGLMTGCPPGASAGRIWRAAVEAVTDEAAAVHDAMTAVAGPHRAFVVTGGWSGSTALMQAKERRFGRLHRPDVAEAGTRGAALLAGLAAGSYPRRIDFPAVGAAPEGP